MIVRYTALCALMCSPLFAEAFTPIPSERSVQCRLHLQNPPIQSSTACQASSSDEPVTDTGTRSSTKSEISARTFTHHIAIKTRNIQNAIDFYSLLGFRLETKFLAADNKLAWLIHETHDENDDNLSSIVSRIELMEVPSYMLNEPEGMKRRSVDLMKRQELLGLNHLALDVTHNIPKTLGEEEKRTSCELYQLQEWLNDLNSESIKRFGRSLRVALEPTKRLIGREIYEMAFIYDADGALVELLNHAGSVEQDIVVDDWERVNRGDTWIQDMFDRFGDVEEEDDDNKGD